jgi:hypothetical protein
MLEGGADLLFLKEILGLTTVSRFSLRIVKR